MLCSEFDPDRAAMINPEECVAPVPGFPEICVFPFSKRIVQQCVDRYQGEQIATLAFCSGQVPIYRMEIQGVTLAMGLPHVGGPAASSFIEEVRVKGGKYFVFFGSAGTLSRDIPLNSFILPTAAIRDEGLSYHYLPPADEVELDPACVGACRQAMEDLGLPVAEGKTWTTDAFYRETRGKMARRKEQGCLCVEMECASLAAVAQFRGVKFAEFFYVTDNLDGPVWDSGVLHQQGASMAEESVAAAVETGKRLRQLDQLA